MASVSYRLLVCEAKLIEIRTNPNKIETIVDIDCVALQVRKICELILLAATLAHVEDGFNLDKKHWHPKDAFRELKKFNAFPLPLPLENAVNFVGGSKQLAPASKPMPFRTLASIYGQCGNIIHVPSAEKILAETIPPFDFAKYKQWVDGFHRLVGGHILLLPEIRKVLVCTWTGRATDPPQGSLEEGDGEAILQLAGLKDFDLLTP